MVLCEVSNAPLPMKATVECHHPPGFQADTRQAIPAWDGLLYTYGIMFVPVFFSLMVGLNLQVWSAARINYVFIFGRQLFAYLRML